MQVRVGMRLISAVCATEVVVVRVPSGDVDVRCGGRPMLAISTDVHRSQGPAPGADGGTLLGKRYVDAAETLEVLCIKPGAGALGLGEELLVTKAPKSLPASD